MDNDGIDIMDEQKENIRIENKIGSGDVKQTVNNIAEIQSGDVVGKQDVNISNENQTGKTNEAQQARGNCSTSADNQEYETQFFGFTPKSFSDGMYNAVLEYTWECFQSTTKFMRDRYPNKVSEENITQASAAILPHLTAAIDKAFDKFESYLRSNIMRVPDHVLLGEDSVHTTELNYSAEQEATLDASIAELEQQIECAKWMDASMRSELQQCARVQAMYDRYAQFLDHIDRYCAELGVPDLREALVYNNDKAIKIKALLAKLQQHPLTKSINTGQ